MINLQALVPTIFRVVLLVLKIANQDIYDTTQLGINKVELIGESLEE